MKQRLTAVLDRVRSTFARFGPGQRVAVLVGAGALLVGGVLLVRWVTTPSYAPLFADLASQDAAAVIEELEAQGVPYQLANGGATVLVPRADVHPTRIRLSGDGIPAARTGQGYSLLDDQGLSTSQFQEQTTYKRAMEGELAATVEAMQDVRTAVVHLAIPEKEVFRAEQDPTTASVLVDTGTTTLGADQVQAVVHLVASSVDGLDPDQVTVADATGQVLSAPAGSAAAIGSNRSQQVDTVQAQLHGRLQSMLDRVVGTGNSTVEVTANLDFDKSVTETTEYTAPAEEVPALSETTSTETYAGPAADGAVTGVVGPDGQMEPGAAESGASSYRKEQSTADHAVGSRVERRETAPGSIESLHVGVVLDSASSSVIDPEEISDLVSATVGIKPRRGDTVEVTALPFDRTAEDAARAELEAAAKARENAALWRAVQWGLGAFALGLAGLVVWRTMRRRARAREEATSYVVDQLRAEQELRAQQTPPPAPATAALAQVELDEAAALREELAALVERQPDDVAALLRGWLVSRP